MCWYVALICIDNLLLFIHWYRDLWLYVLKIQWSKRVANHSWKIVKMSLVMMIFWSKHMETKCHCNGSNVFIIPNACGWLIDHIFYDRMAFNDACHDRLITDLSDWSLSIQWFAWCVSMGSSYKLPKGSFITSWCLTVFVYVTNHYML